MKMRIETVVVRSYKSGPREGEWRTFDLPEGAVILKSYTFGIGDPRMHITYAVPA